MGAQQSSSHYQPQKNNSKIIINKMPSSNTSQQNKQFQQNNNKKAMINNYNINTNNHTQFVTSFLISKNNKEDIDYMIKFIQQRSLLFAKNQHICGVKGYQFRQEQQDQNNNQNSSHQNKNSTQQLQRKKSQFSFYSYFVKPIRKGINNCQDNSSFQKNTNKGIGFNFNINCDQKTNMLLYYERFDDYLVNINQKKWQFQNKNQNFQKSLQNRNNISCFNHAINKNQKNLIKNIEKWTEVQIFYMIYCISDALYYLKKRNPSLNHGDISLKTICKAGHKYKLIDTYFLYGGISGYERILEGQISFISPQQMISLRQGYSKQSPIVKQSDDVFALGMTLLQIMTGLQSKQCYKQSFLRFQPNVIEKRIQKLKQDSIKYSSNNKFSNNSKKLSTNFYFKPNLSSSFKMNQIPFNHSFNINQNVFQQAPIFSMRLIELVQMMIEEKDYNRITLQQICDYDQIFNLRVNKGKISMKQPSQKNANHPINSNLNTFQSFQNSRCNQNYNINIKPHSGNFYNKNIYQNTNKLMKPNSSLSNNQAFYLNIPNNQQQRHHSKSEYLNHQKQKYQINSRKQQFSKNIKKYYM